MLGGIGALMLTAVTATADPPPQPRNSTALSSVFDWSGIYIGGHVGYARGVINNTLSDPRPPGQQTSFGSLYGGLQAGYNHVFPSGFLIGIEADVSFPEFFEDG